MVERMDIAGDILDGVADLLEQSAAEDDGPRAVTCCVEFALLPEHLADYAQQDGQLATAQKADEKDLQVLRAKHHSVARLLAENIPEGVVAEMTGYTKSHISVLKTNPSMVELIAFYRGPQNESAKIIGENLRRVAGMSLELIEKRLESDGNEKISLTELTGIAKLGLDRSGNGPQSTVQHDVNPLIDPDHLLEMSRAARARNATRIVDVAAVRSVIPSKEKQDVPGEGNAIRLPDANPDRDDDRDGSVFDQ